MTTSFVSARSLGALLIAGGVALTLTPAAQADPDSTTPDDTESAQTVQLPGTNSVELHRRCDSGRQRCCKATRWH